MDEEDEFEPLYDYQRQAPCVIPLKDDDEDVVVESSSAGDTKRKAQKKPGPKKQDSEISSSNSNNTTNVDLDDDESWLAPPPKLTKTTTTDSVNKALRMRSAELISLTEKASRDVQELFARQERAAVARAQAAHEKVETGKETEKKSEKNCQKIVIKVQNKTGATQSFRLGTNDMFQKLFTAYANFAGLPVTDLVFRFDGQTVHANSTPSSLDLEDEDIIEVFNKSNTHDRVETEKKSEKESQKIVIKVQNKTGATQSFRLGTNDMFQKLFTGYASFAGLPVADLVFRFDGETVHPNSTPGSLGLEDEDIIEVFNKSNAHH